MVVDVDDLGNQYKIEEFKIGDFSFSDVITIFQDSPIKMTLQCTNINSTAKLISLVGFTQVFIIMPRTSDNFMASLKNLTIKRL
jgi:hypothetical protein